MLAVDQKPEFLPGLPLAPRLPLVQPAASMQQPMSRITRGKDPERFYCPYPNCNRSFAELWRLKVHYRAPPDVRGSGKERGHGCELQYCPKCGKELRAGKHHVGCFAGRAAPRQPNAKRFKVGHGWERRFLYTWGPSSYWCVRACNNSQALCIVVVLELRMGIGLLRLGWASRVVGLSLKAAGNPEEVQPIGLFSSKIGLVQYFGLAYECNGQNCSPASVGLQIKLIMGWS
jgi:hypothetical protein